MNEGQAFGNFGQDVDENRHVSKMPMSSTKLNKSGKKI